MDDLLMEYTNFLHTNYQKFGDDWVRLSDDRIVYNIEQIVNEFKQTENCKYFNVNLNYYENYNKNINT